jgi:peptide/nickel transport system permease protein
VLPAIALAAPTAAVIAQVLAKSLGATWRQPFVETLRATGASRFRIASRHVIRNGAIPVVTMIAIIVGSLLAGSVVTETVFSRSGVGQLTQAAVTHQDIPMVQGVVVLSAVVFVTVNLLVDLVYPLLDPRIVGAAVAVR